MESFRPERRAARADFGKMGWGRRGANIEERAAAKTMATASDDLLLLQALCQAGDAEILRRACEVLQRYRWSDGEHRVIFEVCARLAHWNLPITRDRLAAQMTREGFPDFGLDALFEPLPAAAAQLARRLDEIEGKAR